MGIGFAYAAYIVPQQLLGTAEFTRILVVQAGLVGLATLSTLICSKIFR